MGLFENRIKSLEKKAFKILLESNRSILNEQDEVDEYIENERKKMSQELANKQTNPFVRDILQGKKPNPIQDAIDRAIQAKRQTGQMSTQEDRPKTKEEYDARIRELDKMDAAARQASQGGGGSPPPSGGSPPSSPPPTSPPIQSPGSPDFGGKSSPNVTSTTPSSGTERRFKSYATDDEFYERMAQSKYDRDVRRKEIRGLKKDFEKEYAEKRSKLYASRPGASYRNDEEQKRSGKSLGDRIKEWDKNNADFEKEMKEKEAQIGKMKEDDKFAQSEREFLVRQRGRQKSREMTDRGIAQSRRLAGR